MKKQAKKLLGKTGTKDRYSYSLHKHVIDRLKSLEEYFTDVKKYGSKGLLNRDKQHKFNNEDGASLALSFQQIHSTSEPGLTAYKEKCRQETSSCSCILAVSSRK